MSGGRRAWRQRWAARVVAERGSAVLEFIVIGVLVIVPMAYVVTSVMRVQAATMASTQAVREAARAFATADSVAQGRAAAVTAAQVAFEDQGFVLPESAMRIQCLRACLEPGSSITVDLDWQVGLPWMPSSLAQGRSMSVPIDVVHVVPVDTYRLTRP
ncbi:MAG: hypothetical protein KGP12_12605 [Actinomycetales bacterium]|nr:hypothetical protein [Actinomycetales bacterium]